LPSALSTNILKPSLTMFFKKLALITLAIAGFASCAPAPELPGFNGASCTYVLEPSVSPVVPIPGASVEIEFNYRMSTLCEISSSVLPTNTFAVLGQELGTTFIEKVTNVSRLHDAVE
jgi:hypothetical protein